MPGKGLQQLRRRQRRLRSRVGGLSLHPAVALWDGIQAFSGCHVADPYTLPGQRGCVEEQPRVMAEAAGLGWACPAAAQLGQGPPSAPARDTKGINKKVKEELLKLSLDN